VSRSYIGQGKLQILVINEVGFGKHTTPTRPASSVKEKVGGGGAFLRNQNFHQFSAFSLNSIQVICKL